MSPQNGTRQLTSSQRSLLTCKDQTIPGNYPIPDSMKEEYDMTTSRANEATYQQDHEEQKGESDIIILNVENVTVDKLKC